MMSDLRRSFRIHRPTGVLCLTWVSRRTKRERFPGGEPMHIVVEGRIAKTRRRRKRGVWKIEDGRLYFTCPWCGAIGATNRHNVGNTFRESIYCDPRGTDGGCHRHLSLFYRRRGSERAGFESDYC